MSRFLRRAQPEQASILSSSKLEDEGASGASTPIVATQDTLMYPSSSCKSPSFPQHTPEQIQIMADIKTHLLDLHTSLESKDASYVVWERRWIEDPSTVRRYGKAVKWDLNQAKKRAADTMQWRREFKPDLLVPDKVKIEGETGKHIISGFDYSSRPILYLRPGRENTSPSPRQIEYLVWSLERAIDFCPEGQDKICLLIDYSTATTQSQPSFATSKGVLNILQNHYPERLGKAIVCNVPWILSSFFTLISPFLDPATREKVAMLRSPANVKDSIPLDMLDSDFGGHWKFELNFEKYWANLVEFCGIAPDGTRTHPTKARPTQAADDVEEKKKDVEPSGENRTIEAANTEHPTSTT
ncbi:hypothetical protein CBS101457_006274 [Exobasidium rhododendri]|nr:hypothetical protein CBS101457_006274 [Exobasidium rhododendri]